MISFTSVVSDELNRATGGVAGLFGRVGRFPRPRRVIILFSRVSTLTLSHVSSQSMHRVNQTASVLLDRVSRLSRRVVLFTAAGLCSGFSGTFVHQFSTAVSFNECADRSHSSVTMDVLGKCSGRFSFVKGGAQLFGGVLTGTNVLPCPKRVGGVVHSSVTFDGPSSRGSCLQHLCATLMPGNSRAVRSVRTLRGRGFALHRVRVLAKVSHDAMTQRVGRTDGRWCTRARERAPSSTDTAPQHSDATDERVDQCRQCKDRGHGPSSDA